MLYLFVIILIFAAMGILLGLSIIKVIEHEIGRSKFSFVGFGFRFAAITALGILALEFENPLEDQWFTYAAQVATPLVSAGVAIVVFGKRRSLW